MISIPNKNDEKMYGIVVNLFQQKEHKSKLERLSQCRADVLYLFNYNSISSSVLSNLRKLVRSNIKFYYF